MKRIAVLIVWLALVVHPSAANAKWIRMSSDHFVYIGETSERDIRNIAQRLERFREVVNRLLGDEGTGASIPTVVVVFHDDRSIRPFGPTFQGKRVELSGYYSGSSDASYIAVNAAKETAAYAVILHEYAHSLFRNAVGELPVWASEGLAQVYQTFALWGTRTAVLGSPISENLHLLHQRTDLLSVPDLVAVERESPLYNEGDRRGVFYAESWALVHYLTLGAPQRAGQFQRFLSAIRNGTDGADAFRGAFGADTAALETELRMYLRRLNLNALRVDFDDRIEAAAVSRAEVIADEDAAAYLGEMMAYGGRADDAKQYLRTTIEGGGNIARAEAILGRLELRTGNEGAAAVLCERAVSLAPDMAAAQLGYGRSLLREAQWVSYDSAALLARARIALARALELEPRNAAIVLALAEVEMANDGAEKSVALMRQLVAGAPGRDEYQLMLAQAHLAAGDYSAASALLHSLLRPARSPELQDAARHLLTRVPN